MSLGDDVFSGGATRDSTRFALTDCGEGCLWDVAVFYRAIVASNQPVEGKRDVLSVPVLAPGPPPTVINLNMVLAGGTCGVDDVGDVQDLVARVGVEKVEVDTVCLGPLG